MRPRKTASLAFAISILCFPAAGSTAEPEQTNRVESLRVAEQAFAASVAEKDLERFGSYVDPEAIFLGGSILAGKEAILEVWKVYFAEDAPVLEWHPEEVVVQASGRMGITKGPYTLRTWTSDGQERTRSGSFTSVWEWQADGRWRVVFDSGCPPCPDCETP